MHQQGFTVAGTTPARYFYIHAARKVLTGKGTLTGHYILQTALGHYFSPLDAGPGSDINNVIGAFYGILVMLHYHHGIAQIAQPLQSSQQAVIVPGVQTDAGFIQYVQHPYQAGSHLGSQAYALGFPSGQGSSRPVQGQVVQSHIYQEGKPGFDFLDYLAGNIGFPLAQLQLSEELIGIAHRHGAYFADRFMPQQYPEYFFLEPLTLAAGAGTGSHIFFYFLAHGFGFGFTVTALKIVYYAFIAAAKGTGLTVGVGIVDLETFLAITIENDITLFAGQILDRPIQRYFMLLRHGGHNLMIKGIKIVGPGDYRSISQAFILIQNQGGVDFPFFPQAVTFRTGAERTVKRKHAGTQLR